jgi:hypothetical protein
MTTLTLTTDLEALRTDHDEASAALTALDAELAGLPGAMRVAAEAGDGDEYVRLKHRLHELPDRLKAARLVFARTGFAWAQAAYAELEQRDESVLRTTPVSQLETGGSPYVSRPVDTGIMLARLEGFREALEEAQRELDR